MTITVAVGLCVLACAGAAAEPTTDDGAAIRARVEAYLDAWNAHDAARLATFFTEDADSVMGNLPAARGREAIRESWRAYFERQEPERRLTLDLSPVRFLTPDAALLTVGTTTGGRDGEGRELRARRFRGTWLWHRLGEEWLIAAMRGLPREEDRVVLNASVEAARALRPDIRAFVADYEEAFNAHDPSAVGAFYDAHAEIIVRDSPVIRGREAILDWWRTYFSEPRPYQTLLIVEGIRTIEPDVALVDVRGTGYVPWTGNQPPAVRQTRATWVLARKADHWLLSALWVLPGEDDRIIRDGDGPE